MSKYNSSCENVHANVAFKAYRTKRYAQNISLRNCILVMSRGTTYAVLVITVFLRFCLFAFYYEITCFAIAMLLHMHLVQYFETIEDLH